MAKGQGNPNPKNQFQVGETARARLGGLALQARNRERARLAARAADYEAALRTIYMLTLATRGTPEERLAHIRAYALVEDDLAAVHARTGPGDKLG
jgi:hypothetical protein